MRFWDVYAKSGHPIRTKVSSIGSNILSIMLGLTDVQDGILDIVFRIAEEENLELVDLKDLRSILQYVGDNKDKYITKYGNITTQSIGVIQRNLLDLENQGADKFFGEPSLDIRDFISLNYDGRGIINILDARELFMNPDLYASFMLWLLTELFNTLPEVGDLDKPKIVFFFDEAHLLFNGIAPFRLKQITQIVKLIRSRGIGLYFISQAPTDIPTDIAGQLGNRVQHTLRAYTPSDMKIVKAASDSFRINPEFDTTKAILELGTGEALVSFQTEEGIPDIVEKVTILPPQSRMGGIDDATRSRIIASSILFGKYDMSVDNASAYEKITKINEEKEELKNQELAEKEALKQAKENEKLAKEQEKLDAKARREAELKKKNDPMNKLGKKVATKATNKIIDKSLNKLFKNLFK